VNLWYVGYGSNLLPQAVANYLNDAGRDRTAVLNVMSTQQDDGRWVGFPHPLYFAGRSKTWGGGVAFVDIFKQAEHTTYGRATRLSLQEFSTVITRENGQEVQLEAEDLHYLRPGQTRILQLEVDPEGYRGKYNAVLRLDDIVGTRAYTLTTTRTLSQATPAPGYRERIRTGLLQRLDEVAAERYLQAAEHYAPEL
jgi:hypothetical protein